MLIIAVGLIKKRGIDFSLSENQEREPPQEVKQYLEFLRAFDKTSKSLFVNSDGEIQGIVTGKESYKDEAYDGLKRKRLEYFGLDGRSHKAPLDRVNEKTSSRELEERIIPIETSGGITLHALKDNNIDFLTGREARKLTTDYEDFTAMQREINKLSKQNEKLRDRESELESKNHTLRTEKNDLLEENSTLTEAVRSHRRRLEKLESEKETLTARNKELWKFVEQIPEEGEITKKAMKTILKHKEELDESSRMVGVGKKQQPPQPQPQQPQQQPQPQQQSQNEGGEE